MYLFVLNTSQPSHGFYLFRCVLLSHRSMMIFMVGYTRDHNTPLMAYYTFFGGLGGGCGAKVM